jgi:hypothetical protein
MQRPNERLQNIHLKIEATQMVKKFPVMEPQDSSTLAVGPHPDATTSCPIFTSGFSKISFDMILPPSPMCPV